MVGKEFAITKVADEQQIVLGWANVSMTEDGIPIEDYQHDMIEPEELERAAYEYVLKFRDTGEGHNPKLRKKGKLVESVVFTKEKLEVMGIPEGTIPLGWWIGFKIEDKSTWDKVKKGEYTMFSIEGTGERESIEKASHNPKAMTFDEVFKFNPNHDELGRFASGPGGASGAKTTSSKMSRKQINELPDKVFSHEDFKEAAKLVSDILEEDDYGYFGLRAQEKDTETVGREMKHKSLDMTEEGSNKRLNGVSSVGVTWDGDIHRKAGNYSGRVIYLLGANRNSDELENDPGEKVLQSPTVLAKIVFHDGKMTIADRIVQKHIKAKNFDQIYSKDIEKFNPYHDERGRFTSAPGGTGGSTRTSGSKLSHEPENNPKNFERKDEDELVEMEIKLQENNPKEYDYSDRYAVINYAGFGYEDLNYAMRRGEELDEDLEEMRDGINNYADACKPLTEPLKCYRGSDLSVFDLEPTDSIDKVKELVGKEYTDNAFSSYSLDINVAMGFSPVFDSARGYEEGYRLIIETTFPKGKKLIPVFSISDGASDESEMLPKSGQKIRVVGYDISESRKEVLLKTEALN